MDDFSRLKRQVASIVAFWLTLLFIFGLAVFVGLGALDLSMLISSLITVVLVVIVALLISKLIADKILKPFFVTWRAVTLLADKAQTGAAPQADQLKLGRTLVSNLLAQVYQLASSADSANENSTEHRTKVVQSANIVSHMPLPLFVFNKELLVTNASDIGLEYCKLESSQLFGKSLSENIDFEFSSDRTLDAWIEDCNANKITDTSYWERVRIVLNDGTEKSYRRCDIAAYYNKDNPSGTEFIVTMFDRTEQYAQDDNNMSFVALAVHELRTPLTMLRGYIEVFTVELDATLDDEMKGFLQKMDLSAKQLNAFIGNILNVAKVDENALVLHLNKANWTETLSNIVNELQPKAKINDKIIELQIDKNLPDVAIDQVSILEVVSNLIDNAIKYSDDQKHIIVHAGVGKDGFVETTVQDYGVGVPENVVPHVFEKFYRNHRTKAQIGGSGLGLYLAKSLITAHGGQIWVSSKVGEGSTFGFSIQTYEMLERAQKTTGEDELTRTAHGWIKNHSLYRR